MGDSAFKYAKSWSDLIKVIESLDVKGRWIFRGQAQDWPLASTLERSLSDWEIDLRLAPKIEHQLVREFRRQYDGEDRDLVMSDTLYCLALMQHHGAPTRLLDWTYSPFAATQFAIREGSTSGVLWCLNTAWNRKAVQEIVGDIAVSPRDVDESRNDSSFLPLFMPDIPKKFVLAENPLRLSQRLIIQQGVFLCQGDISDTFINNIIHLPGWDSERNVLKLYLAMDRKNLLKAAIHLQRMNLGSATLFPGLDGFGRSLKERLPHYHDYAKRGVGLPK